MATFVLVHGAWHGGWCWWKVEPLLRRYGSSVYAPSLTGMGERSHLARYIDPTVINLELHIKDVTELLESEGLERVILVGHEHGIRAVKLDLVPIITAMGLATSHLGLGATYSTTYYSPFHVARLFASIDHFTKGRAAWNVVTSLNDSEAQNFGVSEHLPHDTRYDVADEFMILVCELWDSWEPGAIMADRETGRFADSTKVHRVDHSGLYFRSQGAFTVPQTPQGHPVIIQAGQSDRGRRFAARWGELLFVIYPTADGCRAYRADLRRQREASGRNPDSLKVAPAVYVVVGETEEIAQEKLAFIDSLANQTDSLVLLSEVFNYDFAQHPTDEPLSDETLESMTGLRGFLDRVVELSGTKNPSVDDFVRCSGRGTLSELPVFAGTPEQIVDQMESWYLSESCDGFVIAATHMPGAYVDFVQGGGPRIVTPRTVPQGLHSRYSS